MSETQLVEIRNFGIDLDWNSSFGGKSRSNRHLFRVVNLAKELAEGEDVDLSILEAGAWLHDTNLEKTITGSTLENEDKVVSFLRNIGVCDVDIHSILHCIEAHDGRVEARTLEAKIIHDADTLEKTGPLGIIRETWKRSQLGWPTERIVEHLKSHLKKRESKIYLDKAKLRAESFNDELNNFFKTIDTQLKE